VLLYLCCIEVFTNSNRVRIFLSVFLGSAFIVALAGVVEYYWGVDFLRKHAISSSARLNSSFSTSNGLGAYLVPVIGLTAHFLYAAIAKRGSWFLKGVLVVLLILLMSCLCWTYSRSSWVGFLGMLGLTVVIDQRKIFYVGALLLVLVFVFLPSLNQVRHMSLIKDNSSDPIWVQGGSGRIGFWKNAVSVIKMSPVWGTGLNTYAKIIKRNPDQKTWWYAHNGYLQLTAETGLLGLGCFLWVLFVLFKHGLNSCRGMEGLWPLSFLQGTLAGLFGFLVQSFFDNTFFTVQLSVLLWMLTGLLVAVMRLPLINVGKRP
jgi:putative inorganic carbon (HCO3(-)) transporter